tara:strand:+ start:342 stop:527 length:186 start_codon:yes stop_codon:yes gene_type:complete
MESIMYPSLQEIDAFYKDLMVILAMSLTASRRQEIAQIMEAFSEQLEHLLLLSIRDGANGH